MSVLSALAEAIRSATVDVIDLTAPLSSSTPILKLPEPFGNTVPFTLHEISRYDERGPAWYWNDITTGEHTGTHFDAPVHWVTGRDGQDVSQVPLTRLIAPAAVLDFSGQAAADADFLLEVDHIKEWESQHGALPEGGWLLYRTGWDVRSHDQDSFLNANETGPHTPGVSVECARWIAHHLRGHRRRHDHLMTPPESRLMAPQRSSVALVDRDERAAVTFSPGVAGDKTAGPALLIQPCPAYGR